MITANQPFSGWDAVFPDKAMTVAGIDRLVHHATILEMNVESYRRRTALAAATATSDQRPATTIPSPQATPKRRTDQNLTAPRHRSATSRLDLNDHCAAHSKRHRRLVTSDVADPSPAMSRYTDTRCLRRQDRAKRRRNATLEATTRAIFKDWFVDLGPTRAMAEGHEPYLATQIWELFPDALYGEGWAVGWQQGTLADVADSWRRGVSPADVSDDTPDIGLEHLPRRSIALSEWESAGKVTSNKSFFKKGEFLVGKIRPYFHKIRFAPLDGICSTDIVVVVPRISEWAAFTLACLSLDEFVDYTDQTSTGTKMPLMSWKTMGQYKICLSSERVAFAFQGVVQPLLDRIAANIHDARTLARTRNLLLPKFIPGEIQLCAAVEAVA